MPNDFNPIPENRIPPELIALEAARSTLETIVREATGMPDSYARSRFLLLARDGLKAMAKHRDTIADLPVAVEANVGAAPKGCVCPPSAETTCQRWDCGRKGVSFSVGAGVGATEILPGRTEEQ